MNNSDPRSKKSPLKIAGCVVVGLCVLVGVTAIAIPNMI
jgi:hypothetical protein